MARLFFTLFQMATFWVLVQPAIASDGKAVFKGTFYSPDHYKVGENTSSIRLNDPHSLLRQKNQPTFAFRASFLQGNWILLGTPVNSCDIVWDFIAPREGAIEVFGLPVDLENDEIATVFENHPSISIGGTPGSRSLIIDLDALDSEPKIYDLDFLVPLPPMSHQTNREVSMVTGPPSPVRSFVRCTSGALARAGAEGFNTPYAFDTDEAVLAMSVSATGAAVGGPPSGGGQEAVIAGRHNGWFLAGNTGKDVFRQLVQQFGPAEPLTVQTTWTSGEGIILTDVKFAMSPVLNYLDEVLRYAAQAADDLKKEAVDQAARALEERARKDIRSAVAKLRDNGEVMTRDQMSGLARQIDTQFSNLLLDEIAKIDSSTTAGDLTAQNMHNGSGLELSKYKGFLRLNAIPSGDHTTRFSYQADVLRKAHSNFEESINKFRDQAPPRDMSEYPLPDAGEYIGKIDDSYGFTLTTRKN